MHRAQSAFQQRLVDIGSYEALYIDEIAAEICNAAKLCKNEGCMVITEYCDVVIYDYRNNKVIVASKFETAAVDI
jgi:hypothetical protein